MSNIHRGPCKEASYQISVHLGKRIQRRRLFGNQPIRNKNCLWRPCVLTDRDKMNNLYREPSIDASYQVSVYLAKQFQRRFKKNWHIRNKNCLWRPCLLMDQEKLAIFIEDFHRCLIPSFGSFGHAVSEEKINMWKVNGRRMTDAKWWQKVTLPLARWAKNHINNSLFCCLFYHYYHNFFHNDCLV